MSFLYLECAAGVSGDMAAGALLDLGGDRAAVERAVGSLGLEGFSLKIGRVKKSGIDCCDFNVVLDETHENHDHDMEYLYGPAAERAHTHEIAHEPSGAASAFEEHAAAEEVHVHGADTEHSHVSSTEETHEHSHGAHHHEHRSYADVRKILARADMTPSARALAEKIFRILAEAEAKAHSVPIEEVHFHEVGAVDSIIDIVSCAVLFDSLHADGALVSPLSEGTGNVRCQHGVLPVPVPAVVNIVQDTGLILSIQGDWKGERVTPTGAAFAAAIRTEDSLPEQFHILKTGYGAGKRDYEPASILRAFLIERVNDKTQKHVSAKMIGNGSGLTEDVQIQTQREVTEAAAASSISGETISTQAEKSEGSGEDGIWKLETNIDDSTGEQLGFVMDRLMEAGARDVHFIPCFMKKNRPAYILSVITDDGKLETVENIIFRETTTIGIRRWRVGRTCLAREIISVAVDGVTARLKVTRCDGSARAVPEYSDVVKLCRKTDLPFSEGYERILAAGRAALSVR